MATLDSITIRKPDDWHVHLRDGDSLAMTVQHTSRLFARAIVMPNLKPPVTTTEMAQAYRERIQKCVPMGVSFSPLMTAYLTMATSPDDLAKGFDQKILTAAKLYPAGATTNAEAGVSDWRKIRSVFARMQDIGMPLLIHGESIDPHVDVFDREEEFIRRDLSEIVKDYPKLKVVFEHITTEAAVEFVLKHHPQVGATVTPHHLMINRTDMFRGGIRPHYYCLPVAKREKHRLALRKAVTSGHPAFFLGTDSAPHQISDKESACGCAGIFNAPAALELYAQVFDEEKALDRLEAFASVHGPQFYGLPLNQGQITLKRQAYQLPESFKDSAGRPYQPFPLDRQVQWTVL